VEDFIKSRVWLGAPTDSRSLEYRPTRRIRYRFGDSTTDPYALLPPVTSWAWAWAYITLPWLTLLRHDARTDHPSEQEACYVIGDENRWSFGQIAAMLIIVGGLYAVLRFFLPEQHRRGKKKGERIHLFFTLQPKNTHSGPGPSNLLSRFFRYLHLLFS
jgi:hypothetical protein